MESVTVELLGRNSDSEVSERCSDPSLPARPATGNAKECALDTGILYQVKGHRRSCCIPLQGDERPKPALPQTPAAIVLESLGSTTDERLLANAIPRISHPYLPVLALYRSAYF